MLQIFSCQYRKPPRSSQGLHLAKTEVSTCSASLSIPHKAAGGYSRASPPEHISCCLGAERTAFPLGWVRKVLHLGSQAALFPQQSLILDKAVTLLLSFPGLLFFHTSIPPPPQPSKNTSPNVCKASASCLTSLIYKANRMFLLTHIMLSLLMKKTIPGGQPRGLLKPASKNSSNAQRVRSSKTIFHTMK